MIHHFALPIVLGAVLVSQNYLAAEVTRHEVDVCVYGGTASGVMAASAALGQRRTLKTMGSHRVQERSTNQNQGMGLYQQTKADQGERVGAPGEPTGKSK